MIWTKLLDFRIWQLVAFQMILSSAIMFMENNIFLWLLFVYVCMSVCFVYPVRSNERLISRMEIIMAYSETTVFTATYLNFTKRNIIANNANNLNKSGRASGRFRNDRVGVLMKHEQTVLHTLSFSQTKNRLRLSSEMKEEEENAENETNKSAAAFWRKKRKRFFFIKNWKRNQNPFCIVGLCKKKNTFRIKRNGIFELVFCLLF